jgi:hypothetical protein
VKAEAAFVLCTWQVRYPGLSSSVIEQWCSQ